MRIALRLATAAVVGTVAACSSSLPPAADVVPAHLTGIYRFAGMVSTETVSGEVEVREDGIAWIHSSHGDCVRRDYATPRQRLTITCGDLTLRLQPAGTHLVGTVTVPIDSVSLGPCEEYVMVEGRQVCASAGIATPNLLSASVREERISGPL